MKKTCAGLVLATVVALTMTACRDTSGTDVVPLDQAALTQATNDAVALLERSPRHGYQSQPTASGHDRADDAGHEVSETVHGRALFQIACSGQGKVTVTMPRQDVSKLVRCGQDAASVPFRRQLTALVVGQANSTGAYAWRILPAG